MLFLLLSTAVLCFSSVVVNGAVGGKLSVYDPTVLSAAEFARGAIEYWDQYIYRTRLLRVSEASFKGVPGTSITEYHIKFDIIATECHRGSRLAIAYCMNKEGEVPNSCTATVTDDPNQEQSFALSKHHCVPPYAEE